MPEWTLHDGDGSGLRWADAWRDLADRFLQQDGERVIGFQGHRAVHADVAAPVPRHDSGEPHLERALAPELPRFEQARVVVSRRPQHGRELRARLRSLDDE